ncbi:class I SAM-dependent methyltransferase [Streptomyces sp. NPDC101158]|uniref:class I SAM-dependent methyltransferase n=1 Tax=Streptomyces sp. NPDC101158 TaxID=3366117 RepID=UPI0038079747
MNALPTKEESPMDAHDAHQVDGTALRVALWRALHLQVDPAPHVLDDALGLRLAAPAAGWRERSDMHPEGTRRMRASIVARARFVEDLVTERARDGVGQYVLLGAGLDTFAQRRADPAAGLRVFEVDQPGTQAWKRRRLAELGLDRPDGPRFVPVDFEAGDSWWDGLVAAGFDPDRPAVVASLGVSMYLTREATVATLRRVAALAPGSTLAMTFMLPLDLVGADERPALQATQHAARAAGTPFVSLYAPSDLLALTRETGFRDADHISSAALAARYFGARSDGLRPSGAEGLVVATV